MVAQAQDGDRKAFSELVRRHQTAIYRVCFRILCDAEDAADATQEAFMRAYDKLSTFHNQSAFRTWMTRVAVNVSLNARSHQRDGVPLDDMLVAADPSVEDTVVRAEAVQQLHGALQGLPFNHRVAVILRDLEGLSYREVAQALGVPEGTAKGWAHRGRAQLKELLT
ncbi:MAG: sigma-70 family RNA polymerase sigma factor [Herpetosiphonaceae bacterium]|nr:sigma-70 family RNA polymerase sigma factor [Herpetosiphonaceae bacterium]